MYNIKCIFRQTDKIIPLISNYSYIINYTIEESLYPQVKKI